MALNLLCINSLSNQYLFVDLNDMKFIIYWVSIIEFTYLFNSLSIFHVFMTQNIKSSYWLNQKLVRNVVHFHFVIRRIPCKIYVALLVCSLRSHNHSPYLLFSSLIANDFGNESLLNITVFIVVIKNAIYDRNSSVPRIATVLSPKSGCGYVYITLKLYIM